MRRREVTLGGDNLWYLKLTTARSLRAKLPNSPPGWCRSSSLLRSGLSGPAFSSSSRRSSDSSAGFADDRAAAGAGAPCGGSRRRCRAASAVADARYLSAAWACVACGSFLPVLVVPEGLGLLRQIVERVRQHAVGLGHAATADRRVPARESRMMIVFTIDGAPARIALPNVPARGCIPRPRSRWRKGPRIACLVSALMASATSTIRCIHPRRPL